MLLYCVQSNTRVEQLFNNISIARSERKYFGVGNNLYDLTNLQNRNSKAANLRVIKHCLTL